MARLSKSSNHPFTIYQDSGIPTPDSAYEPSFDDSCAKAKVESDAERSQELKYSSEEAYKTEHDAEADPLTATDLVQHSGYDDETDDERRISAVTNRTSVSSLPEWTDSTDTETKPYTPPVIRPSFMRPESVRRMQMRSPPPFRSPRSARQSVLRHSRSSRAGTPRSAVSALGSPQRSSHRHISDETTQSDGTQAAAEQDAKIYPLVLLHVTLLPVHLPWSMEAMQELLPESTLDQLQVLKGKISETILQRGILIPHPKEEYEMLEERLLEALELQEERVTKCGHFRGSASRDSTGSESTLGDSSDSGMGSSVEGFDVGERCAVCHDGVRSAKSGRRTGKWTVKIYAANGLMRASAWTAAWSEMERVDVEILPFINEGLRKQLDARQEQDDAEERARLVAENARVRASLEEQLRRDMEFRRRDGDVRQSTEDHSRPRASHPSDSAPRWLGEPAPSDLPRIYRPSEIPLSILLRNYVLLLLQDRRNVVISFLTLLVLLLGMRWAAAPLATVEQPSIMTSLEHTCSVYYGQAGMLVPDVNGTMMSTQTNLTEGVLEAMNNEIDADEGEEKNDGQLHDADNSSSEKSVVETLFEAVVSEPDPVME